MLFDRLVTGQVVPINPAAARRADLLAERGQGILYKTVRRWMLKFGPLIARGPCGSI
jgi:hypothetical protein